jgi:hypothetical protein
LLHEVLEKDISFDDFKSTYELPTGQEKIMLVSGRKLAPEEYMPMAVLVALDDVTDKG